MLFNILYPVLFSLIPIFIFYNKNIGEVSIKYTLYLIFISISIELSCFFLIYYILYIFSIKSAALSASILFYSNILFYTPKQTWERFISRYAYQYVIKYIFYACIAFSGIIFSFMPFIFTVIFSLIIFLNIIYAVSAKKMEEYTNLNCNIIDINNTNEKPDIYHIVLDAYIGNQGINDISNYDNNIFYQQLREMGFNVYENIYANYANTFQSIPSIMNMKYMTNNTSQNMQDIDCNDFFIRQQGYLDIIYSSTILSLKKAGYKIIMRGDTIFDNTILMKTKDIVDNFLSLSNNNIVLQSFLNMTIIGALFHPYSNKIHAKHIQNMFQTISNLYDDEYPCYYFMHVLAPHPPYCFKQNGKINNNYSDMNFYEFTNDAVNAYIEHVTYINKLTIEALKKLITNIKQKNKKAVILLHGDHGNSISNNPKTRFNTLLAEYTFNMNKKQIFHDNMTLINMQKHLFNYLFDSNLTYEKDEIIMYDELLGDIKDVYYIINQK